MRTINFLDACNSLRAVLDQVVADADVTLVKRGDAPDAVIMSLDHYNGLMETVHLLSSPANAAHLERSLAQARAGGGKSHDLIEAPDDEQTDAQP
jgi:antitoxin YefM